MKNVEADAVAIDADPSLDPTTVRRGWHAFTKGTIKPPVRVLDSRQGRIYEPSAILAELGSGEKIVVCSLADTNYHVYRLAPFEVSWTELCPHDLNFVAKPPRATP